MFGARLFACAFFLSARLAVDAVENRFACAFDGTFGRVNVSGRGVELCFDRFEFARYAFELRLALRFQPGKLGKPVVFDAFGFVVDFRGGRLRFFRRGLCGFFLQRRGRFLFADGSGSVPFGFRYVVFFFRRFFRRIFRLCVESAEYFFK